MSITNSKTICLLALVGTMLAAHLAHAQRPQRQLNNSRYSRFGRPGTSPRSGKDAPKPTDPPSKWHIYINKNYKPKPRPKADDAPKSGPKPRPSFNRFSPYGRPGTSPRSGKDAPKPTDPPSKWHIYINKNYKPKPRPKADDAPKSGPKQPPFGRRYTGAVPRTSKPLPPQPRDIGRFPRDLRAPYVHPPRDGKPPQRPKR